jgi:methylmalonyl-CoA epimerase
MKMPILFSGLLSFRNLVGLILIPGVAMVSFSFGKKYAENSVVIESKKVTQVAVIVKDIDKARNAWASVLGMPVPEVSIAEGHESRPTQYKDKSTDAKCKLAFLRMENLQIELIQPLGGKSTWQEYLDKSGEGIHHIAFNVKDINGVEKKFATIKMPTVQRGGWNGGAYSYVDASADLGCILELLENYGK